MLGVVARKLWDRDSALACPRRLRTPGAAAAALAVAAARHDESRRWEGEGRSEEQVVVAQEGPMNSRCGAGFQYDNNINLISQIKVKKHV